MKSTRSIVLAGTLAVSAAASADSVLWGITRVDDNHMATLVTIDEDTGAAAAQFQIALPEDFSPGAMAFHGPSATLYSVAHNTAQDMYRLLVVSPDGQIGDSAPITGLPAGEQKIAGLEYDPVRDQLLITFGATGLFQENRIAELNLDGSVAQVSDAIGLEDSDSLAWEATMGRLIACDFNANDGLPRLAELITIFGTPAWSGIANPPTNGNVGDAAVDPVTGRFFISGFNDAGGYLVELIGAYGTYSTVGAYGAKQQVTGIAFVDESDCIGDVDGDGEVAVGDVLEVLSAWGPCAAPCPADLDDNGEVDVNDLLEVLGAWGPC